LDIPEVVGFSGTGIAQPARDAWHKRRDRRRLFAERWMRIESFGAFTFSGAGPESNPRANTGPYAHSCSNAIADTNARPCTGSHACTKSCAHPQSHRQCARFGDW
jgi:hypothetical protein